MPASPNIGKLATLTALNAGAEIPGVQAVVWKLWDGKFLTTESGVATTTFNRETLSYAVSISDALGRETTRSGTGTAIAAPRLVSIHYPVGSGYFPRSLLVTIVVDSAAGPATATWYDAAGNLLATGISVELVITSDENVTLKLSLVSDATLYSTYALAFPGKASPLPQAGPIWTGLGLTAPGKLAFAVSRIGFASVQDKFGAAAVDGVDPLPESWAVSGAAYTYTSPVSVVLAAQPDLTDNGVYSLDTITAPFNLALGTSPVAGALVYDSGGTLIISFTDKNGVDCAAAILVLAVIGSLLRVSAGGDSVVLMVTSVTAAAGSVTAAVTIVSGTDGVFNSSTGTFSTGWPQLSGEWSTGDLVSVLDGDTHSGTLWQACPSSLGAQGVQFVRADLGALGCIGTGGSVWAEQAAGAEAGLSASATIVFQSATQNYQAATDQVLMARQRLMLDGLAPGLLEVDSTVTSDDTNDSEFAARSVNQSVFLQAESCSLVVLPQLPSGTVPITDDQITAIIATLPDTTTDTTTSSTGTVVELRQGSVRFLAPSATATILSIPASAASLAGISFSADFIGVVQLAIGGATIFSATLDLSYRGDVIDYAPALALSGPLVLKVTNTGTSVASYFGAASLVH